MYASPSHMYASTSHMYASTSHMYYSPSHMYASPSHMYASPSHMYDDHSRKFQLIVPRKKKREHELQSANGQMKRQPDERPTSAIP